MNGGIVSVAALLAIAFLAGFVIRVRWSSESS
jgi:hypothetical protein